VNQNGVKTVFAVRGVRRGADCEATWYRVQLPLRPNGTTGFVRARAVRLVKVRTRIVVDLSARKIELYRDGRRILRMPAAVGSPVTPTPTGDFYVNQKLLAANPAGPFGPGALGISAFSPVLRHWAQGGPIAIHGTNDPASIGRAVSHGCVRVSNDNLVRLWNHTPAGTPVEIRA
jgi:lipoprotein-anchoring transpeptidase ErfK/SrfK